MGSSALIKSWRYSLSLDEEAGDFQWLCTCRCLYLYTGRTNEAGVGFGSCDLMAEKVWPRPRRNIYFGERRRPPPLRIKAHGNKGTIYCNPDSPFHLNIYSVHIDVSIGSVLRSIFECRGIVSAAVVAEMWLVQFPLLWHSRCMSRMTSE